jgi:hypothetical protein
MLSQYSSYVLIDFLCLDDVMIILLSMLMMYELCVCVQIFT